MLFMVQPVLENSVALQGLLAIECTSTEGHMKSVKITYMHIMDLIQVGVSVTGSRKKESAESVPRIARPSQQHQAGPTFSTQVVLGISYVTYRVT